MTREEQLDWLCRLRSEVKIYMPIEWVDHFEDALTESINILSQEPKTGKWIVHEKPHGIRYLECPCCNIWYLNEHLIRNSYCPNCGAKMENVEKSLIDIKTETFALTET